MSNQPRIAFVHDWLVEFGGAEQVLVSLLEIWPDAGIYTIVHDPSGPCGSIVAGRQVETSFIQKLPRAKRKYRSYLPLMPLAVEQFNLQDFDIIISLSYSVAHGIIPQNDQLHINYIHLPARYAWHLYHEYISYPSFPSGIMSWFAKLSLHYLRLWDATTPNRIDQYVANSQWTAKNVWRYYRRDADVIYPPIEVSSCSPDTNKENFFVTVSRIVPYKRIDLIVDSFTKMDTKELIVIGDGPDLQRIKEKAGRNITFLGYQPFDIVKEYLERARALIFASTEDFGMVPVEAQACGTPVIAYRKGGVMETVIEGETGIFFDEQTPNSLVEAIERFEKVESLFEVKKLRSNVERFSKERFQREFSEFVELQWRQHRELNMPSKTARTEENC